MDGWEPALPALHDGPLTRITTTTRCPRPRGVARDRGRANVGVTRPTLAGVIVRLADPTDAEELAAVGELTVAAYAADGYLEGTDGYADQLRAAGDRAREAVLVVAADDPAGLLGTVTYCAAGTPWAELSVAGEAEVRMLAVSPAARGRGVGTTLTDWCVSRARSEGHSAVVLSTLVVMHAAHRLYERMGFVRTPDRDWWPIPDLQLITYRLAL